MSGCASALALAASLSACTTVGPNFARPAAPATPGYAAAGETGPQAQQVKLGQSVAARWWEYLASPELDQVMRLAVEGSPTLEAADATLAAAQAEIRAVRADSAPQLNVSGGISGQRLNLQSFGFDVSSIEGFSNNPTFALYSVGATASYAVDPFGLNRRQVESALAKAETQAHQADAAYLSLTGNVALQAAQIAAINAQRRVLSEIIADDQKLVDLTRKANELGAEGGGPPINARAQLTADQARMPALDQQRDAARHALSVLVGRAPADWSPPEFDFERMKLPAEIPLSLPSELVRRRPDILAAEARLHAATADIGVATAKLYPSFNITASLTQSAISIPTLFTTNGTAASLGAALAAPILDGGRLRAQREAARQTARAELATYEATVIQAFGQVADLLQALAHDEQTIAAQTQARETAMANLRLARSGFEGGATGILPVLDAQRQVNSARYALVQAEAQRYVHTIQLFVATGSGLREARGPASPSA